MSGLENFPVLVAGGGMAGLRASLDLAASGKDVLLVEAGRHLGGGIGHIASLFPTGENPANHLASLVTSVADSPRIAVMLETAVAAIAGEPGHFHVTMRRAGEPGESVVAAASIVLATGCAPFDPDVLDTFGHGNIPDVVTSLAFESMLAASGSPTRPSDGAAPLSLAFILCVGSRMRHPVDRGYCSGVCCATALNQALAVRNCARTLFAIDFRTHVPGAQAALERATADGVRVCYARPHTLTPGPAGRGVTLRYVDEKGFEHEETVDMAVLAVGLEVPEATRSLARTAGISLTRHGFVRTTCFEPIRTSRDGIFVAGALRGPEESALAAIQGSAAAQAVLAVSRERGEGAGKAAGAAMVIGGGVAGLTAALALAECGADVTLVECADRLGGNPRKQPSFWKGQETWPAVMAMVETIDKHPKVTVCLSSRLLAVSGEPGRFCGSLESSDGSRSVDFGAAVLALGGVEGRSGAYLLGRDPRVFTQLGFEDWRRQRPKEAEAAKTVVFIQCVGSREPGLPACSRLCCAQALCAAVELKKSHPDTLVAIFYRDITTYGENEDLYTEARRLGVLFFRYTPDEPPIVERIGTSLTVTCVDRLLDRSVRLRPDCLVLAAPLITTEVAAMAGIFGCKMDSFGFLAPAHPVFHPVDTSRPGVFAAGLCLGPKPLDETITEARAAAMRAWTFLSGN
jgi:heterodisulfide reductase subunit A